MTTVSTGYLSAHKAPVNLWGKASEHLCIDCGGQAQQWSYQHTSNDEKFCPLTGFVYSENPEDYAPRCVSCHRKFDYMMEPEKRAERAVQLAQVRTTPRFKEAASRAMLRT